MKMAFNAGRGEGGLDGPPRGGGYRGGGGGRGGYVPRGGYGGHHGGVEDDVPRINGPQHIVGNQIRVSFTEQF